MRFYSYWRFMILLLIKVSGNFCSKINDSMTFYFSSKYLTKCIFFPSLPMDVLRKITVLQSTTWEEWVTHSATMVFFQSSFKEKKTQKKSREKTKKKRRRVCEVGSRLLYPCRASAKDWPYNCLSQEAKRKLPSEKRRRQIKPLLRDFLQETIM